MLRFNRIPNPALGLLLCLIYCDLSSAQGTKSLRCPTPKRQKVYTTPPQAFLDVTAGAMMPLLYRNTGDLESHFHFNARPGPYVAVTGHLKYSTGLELTLATELLHNQQGLVMKYNEGDANIREAGYTSAFVFRMPIAVGYSIRPGWTITAGAFIAYSTYWTYTNSGRQSLNGSGSALASQHMWQVPEGYNKWYPGIILSTKFKIIRRISGNAFWSIDLAQATPNAGSLTVTVGGSSQTLKATLEPYLMNAGLGLSYRIGKE